MIDKSDVVRFFDSCAPTWDEEMIRSDKKINIILDNAHISAGSRVLDVACGTGVLIPDYLKRGVSSVTGIDISTEMIKLAQQKFTQPNVHFICGDVEAAEVGTDFDAIVVYNAFPHFPAPQRLIEHLAGLLKVGGMLTVAHGMSREMIDSHHEGSAHRVSNGLMSAEDLSAIFKQQLEVTTVISNDEMYQVTGKRIK